MAKDSQFADVRAEQPSATSLSQKLYFAAWRWHFYAALYVVPFMIMLAVTGMMMMFITQFDGRDGEKIAVTPQGTALSVTDQAAAATSAVPGNVVEYIGPKSDALATVFRVNTADNHQMVAVDPYTGDVLGNWDRRTGWYDFADNVHGSLLLGDTGDRLIEIAAGLGLVLVLTGLYLWWPRGGDTSVFIPNLKARGRALWKSLHAVTGFWISALLVVFLVSGLAWAGIWGGKYVQAWSTFPAEKWNDVPLSDSTHASMNHGNQNDVPWALEQTPMPASGSEVGVTGTAEGAPVDLTSLVALGRDLGLEGRFRVAYPRDETGVWTINQDSMSGDSATPTVDATIHVDQYTGKILAEVRFADYSVAGKSMAVGIPLHMGLMGLWNLLLNTVFCLLVIFVCISGVVMWLKRRPAKALRLAAPPAPTDMPLFKGVLLIAALVSVAFPLVGVTLLAVLAFDVLVVGNIPALKRALS